MTLKYLKEGEEKNKMQNWTKLASKRTINKSIKALKENGINALFVESEEEAKEKVFEIIPKGAEVFSMTSVTLDELNLSKEINEFSDYDSVRNKLMSMNRETQRKEMRKLGSSPDWAIGSVHAVTEDGKILIASNTGSQLPAYSYGAGNIILVIGSHKIVKDVDEGIKRIYAHSLPLESERAKKAYGVPGSSVSKLLIINKEIQPNRINLIIVNKVLGF